MSVVRTVRDGLTVRRVLLVESAALLLLIVQWISLDESWRFSRYMADTSVTYCASALLFLVGTLCAEESVRRGVRPSVAFPLALLGGSLLGGLIHTTLWFDPAWRRERSEALFVLENAIEVGLWGGLGMFVYSTRNRADRMQQHVRQAQMKQMRMEHRLVASRLAAARARIDVPALLAELTSIRDSLRRNEAQATVTLDELTQRLRESRVRVPVSRQRDR